jgi:hypothetical protein
MTNEEFLSTLTTIPDHELCELACEYAVAQEMSGNDVTTHLGHLLHEHDCFEAAELMLALLKFHAYCARRERELFHLHGIEVESRFGDDCDKVLAEATTKVDALRTEHDAAEAAAAVKH